MTIWKRWAAVAALLGAGVSCALTAGVALRRSPRRHPAGGDHRLLLLRTNALHTDLGIPATPDIRRRFAFLKDVGIPVDEPAMTHILVGWGAEGFYPDNQRPYRISPIDLFHAVIGDDSVLRFAPLAEPGGDWEGKFAIPLSGEALDALVAFVERTLDRHPDGTPKALDHPGILAIDHFFEAKPDFAVRAGCNVWVSEALAEAGVATGRWTPLPQTLTASIRHHRR